MSAIINDGGPAFPVTVHQPYKKGSWKHNLPGVSLRDYFANDCPLTPADFAPVYGMPLAEIMRDTNHAKSFWALYAEERFTYADAMLAERAKGGAR